MAVIYEDFIRCSCGESEFIEERRITLHKKILERTDKSQPLAAMDVQYVYACVGCGKILDK